MALFGADGGISLANTNGEAILRIAGSLKSGSEAKSQQKG